MKAKVFLILAFVLSTAFAGFAQNAADMAEKGFSNGDATVVGKSMAGKVFYVCPPVRKLLEKEEAEKQLDAFFKEKKPKTFSIIHDSKLGDVRYVICKLVTPSGDYRVHLLFDTSKDNQEITQIRIESL